MMMMVMWEVTVEIGDNDKGDGSVDETHPPTRLAAIELLVKGC